MTDSKLFFMFNTQYMFKKKTTVNFLKITVSLTTISTLLYPHNVLSIQSVPEEGSNIEQILYTMYIFQVSVIFFFLTTFTFTPDIWVMDYFHYGSLHTAFPTSPADLFTELENKLKKNKIMHMHHWKSSYWYFSSCVFLCTWLQLR